MRKLIALSALTIFSVTGCGSKSGTTDSAATPPTAAATGAAEAPAAAAVGNPFIGTWKTDLEATKKIVMARMQKETPNRPYDDMVSHLPGTSSAPDGLSLTITPDGKYSAAQNGSVVGSGTWTLAGDSLKMARADVAMPPTEGKIVDGELEMSNGPGSTIYLIK